MSYQILSLRFRPQQFNDVIGQVHVTQTLKNAIKLNRVAHGYIFSGPRGVGKTTTARILAKSLNCEDPNEYNSCGECLSCKEVKNGSNLDVQEFDGASNRGIDEIRDLREAVKYPPNKGKYRIYIIDEVHMLTREAFNALLEGVSSAQEIDQAMRLGCHHPMGPLELADFIGLDTCLSILRVMHKGLGDPRYRPSPLLISYVDSKRLGKKTRKGVYNYSEFGKSCM